MKNYIKRFIHEDEGAEMLEWAIGIAITAILITVVMVIVSIVKNKTLESGKKIEGAGNNGGASHDWDAYKDNVDSALANMNGNN